jgi:hypothetical protein
VKKLFLVFCLFLISKVLLSQDDTFVLNGRIYDNTNFQAVPYIKITNASKKTSSYTNVNGIYQIICGQNDSLIFSGTGYKKVIIQVNDSVKYESRNFLILMEPEIYELNEVAIFDLGTYSDFKRKLLAIEPKKEMVIDLGLPSVKPGPPDLVNDNIVRSLGFALASPISFLYYNLNEKEKSKRKIYKLIAEAPITYEIEKKFNREKVGLWTGLTDIELNEFIVFCNFDRTYLLNAKEYDIILLTKKKLEEFKQKKSLENQDN